MIAIKTITI